MKADRFSGKRETFSESAVHPKLIEPRDIELIHFEQTCELLRHHSSLRLKQLAVFVAVNGGLFFGLFRIGDSLTQLQLLAFATLGLAAALAFGILEVRLSFYLDHYRRVVLDYERRFDLPHNLFAPELRGFFFRGRLAVLMFIGTAMGAWALALIILMENASKRAL